MDFINQISISRSDLIVKRFRVRRKDPDADPNHQHWWLDEQNGNVSGYTMGYRYCKYSAAL
jgi:hypothetical protein